jgi:cell wall-associated NlpC family hydrolase
MQAMRGIAVDWRTEPIQAGDLVFMFTNSHPDVISHVGIAIDSKRWIHAPRSGDVVRVGMLPSADKIQAVRRYVTP